MSACFIFPPLIIFELPLMMVLLSELGYHVVSTVSATGEMHSQATQFQNCNAVFTTKGGVDVGMICAEDGTFSLVCDEQQLANVEGISKLELQSQLSQKYSQKKVTEELAKHGFTIVEQETLEDNTVKIRVRRWN